MSDLRAEVERMPRVGYQAVYGTPNSGWAIPEQSVIAAVADSLDAAWAEAEAALPEGWRVTSLLAPGNGDVADDDDWEAHAQNVNGATRYAYGPTPTAALRALAAALRVLANSRSV